MNYDFSNFNVERILEIPNSNTGDEFEVLTALRAYTQEFRSNFEKGLETSLHNEEEYVRKCEAITDHTTQLHEVKKAKLEQLENVCLEIKLKEKKIASADQQQVKLKQEIEEAKSRKESIMLEIVDLEQALDTNKKLKKNRWNAIKMACLVYKENLNFHIDYEDREDHDLVKVTFFRRQRYDRDSYYVNLSNYNNSWKVGEIEPQLKESHLEELNTAVDTTKPLDVPNVIVLLCKLRTIFSKHYFNPQ